MEQLMTQNPWLAWLIIIVLLWTLPWKALALWRAARNGDKVWFIIFVVVNTVGILEIIYLFIFGKYDQKAELAKTDVKLPEITPQPEESVRKVV